MSLDKSSLGQSIRSEVLGDAAVGGLAAISDPFNEPLQRWFTEAIWADIWGREDLSRRDRSMITIAILLALARTDELRAHLPAALRNGCELVEIREIILHAAAYCGGPKALAGLKAANEVLANEIADLAAQSSEQGAALAGTARGADQS